VLRVLARRLVPHGQPDLRMRSETRNEALRAVARVTESQSSVGACEGGRKRDRDGESVPLQKHLPTGFVG